MCDRSHGKPSGVAKLDVFGQSNNTECGDSRIKIPTFRHLHVGEVNLILTEIPD